MPPRNSDYSGPLFINCTETLKDHLHLDVSNSVYTKENSFQLLLPQSSRSNTMESSLTALSHTPHISSVNKSYWFHLRNIPRI